MQKVRGIVIAAVFAGVVGGGCGGGRHATPNAGLETIAGRSKARPALRPPVRTPTPPDPADRAALAEMIRQQAIDTQKILDGEPPPAARAAVTPPTAVPQARTVAAGPPALPPAAAAPTPVNASPPAPAPAAAPAPVLSIDERVHDAADRLAAVLQEQAGATASIRPRAAIAALDALKLRPSPGGAAPLPESMSPGQRQAIDGLREAIGALTVNADAPDPDSDRLAEQLRSLADRIGAAHGLSISDLRLCTRVRGFGQFTTFPQSGTGPDAAVRLVAGGASRALVYVELDRFAHRAIDSSDPELAAARDRGEQWVVDLTQEINLYSERGNLLVHRRPPERVVETSRSRRRDFYLVTEIALPTTLGAGVYHLKVMVRDRTSNSVAERSLPIEIVADAALVRGDAP